MKNLNVFSLVLLAALSVRAATDPISVTIPTGYSSNYYRYCPATLVDESGTRHAFYCRNRDSKTVVDYIYHATVAADGTLSGEAVVLSPSDTTGAGWDSYHVCDPSVIAGAFYYNGHTYKYLMAYLGVKGKPGDTTSDGAKCINNKVGFAVSDSLASGWTRMGSDAVVVTGTPANWGVGQPSIVSLDGAGKVGLFYAGDYGTRFKALDFTDATATTASLVQITGDKGASVSRTNVSDLKGLKTTGMTITNGDFAYDANTGLLYLVCDTPDAHNGWYDDGGVYLYVSKAVTVYRCSLASLTETTVKNVAWQRVTRLQPADLAADWSSAGRCHNAGLVRTPGGALAAKTAMVTLTNVQSSPLWTYRFKPVAWADDALPEVSFVSTVRNEKSGLVTVSYSLEGGPSIVTVDFLTNGVSIGEKSFVNVHGDVNRKVASGRRTLSWRPNAACAGFDAAAGKFAARVKAWTKELPPDYMVVDLCATNDVVRYYVSTNALPMGGLANDLYRKSKLVMRRIPAKGMTWTMGSASGETGRIAARETRHLVTFTNDYWMGIYPVTYRQYANMNRTQPLFGYWSTNTVGDSRYVTKKMYDLRPQTNVSLGGLRGSVWKSAAAGGPDADTYAWPQKGHQVKDDTIIGKIRTSTGIAFDLPTDAQWEFAARAGTATAYFFGNSMVANGGWTKNNTWPDGVQSPHPVGETLANQWGLYDLYGNVLETCLDRYVKNDTMPETSVTEPTGPLFTSDMACVQRGGAYNWVSSQSRSGYREWCGYGWAGNERGFRLWAPVE